MRLLLLIFSLLTAIAQGQTPGNGADILPRGKEAIYKAEFNISGNSINGFLAVSHKLNDVLHVSFTSPMGNNLLEMRWKNGRWKKIYAIDKVGGRLIISMKINLLIWGTNGSGTKRRFYLFLRMII
jgi:hypothetical protein